MSAVLAELRAGLQAALNDAERVAREDRGTASEAYDAGRYDGLKQALELLAPASGERAA